MEIINTLIGIPLGYLMWLCFILLKNYGLAIILFTLLTKLILLPVNIWVQKNSVKMVKLQPEMNEIAAKNVGNREKISELQLALYKRENYHPMSGLLPMLIQIPIILGLISVIYNPLQHLLHLDSSVIATLIEKLGLYESNSSGAQIIVIEYIKDPALFGRFSDLGIASSVLDAIKNMDLQFLGFNLAHTPSITSFDLYLLFPILSGLSSLLLCVFQNRENVLQKEQGFIGRWGMAVFLTVFSTYFAFIVPAGVGLYWIMGNIFAIVMLYVLNAIYNPKKYIDYEALEKSKIMLAESRKLEKTLRPTKEAKARAKADYKRFFAADNIKKLIYYSEKSGFYKYFEGQLNYIFEHSDLTVHYVTSDPNDVVFGMDNPRLVPYYIDDNRLIPLFMKIDADAVVMTTPNLQTYHLKRSLVRKNVEYIYTPHDPLSVHMGVPKGGFDYFDTVLCVGPAQVSELRMLEDAYGTKPKNLMECGYSLIDNLIAEYDKLPAAQNEKPKILIAPSWQEGNILEGGLIDDLLSSLLDKGYDITVRPHPEFTKRFAVRMNAIIEKYKSRFGDDFRIETDFSSNVTIFTADMVITDWSGIALEFSFATLKPSLFINTPKKVMNPEYDKISAVPIEVSIRGKIGASLDEGDCKNAGDAVSKLLGAQGDFTGRIKAVLDETVFNIGHSAEVEGQYIIGAANKGRK